MSTDPTAGTAYDNYLALQGAGVAGAESIGGVFYFQNAFDTTTTGVDVVGTYKTSFYEGSNTSFTASVNYNKTEIDDVKIGGLFNAESTFDFENFDPNWRGVFSVVHDYGPWTFTGRANYYGEYTNSDTGGNPLRYQDYGAELFIDLEAAYQVSEIVKVSVGARNILDEYPDEKALGDNCCGRVYSSGTIVDWQGGYYYFKLKADL